MSYKRITPADLPSEIKMTPQDREDLSLTLEMRLASLNNVIEHKATIDYRIEHMKKTLHLVEKIRSNTNSADWVFVHYTDELNKMIWKSQFTIELTFPRADNSATTKLVRGNAVDFAKRSLGTHSNISIKQNNELIAFYVSDVISVQINGDIASVKRLCEILDGAYHWQRDYCGHAGKCPNCHLLTNDDCPEKPAAKRTFPSAFNSLEFHQIGQAMQAIFL